VRRTSRLGTGDEGFLCLMSDAARANAPRSGPRRSARFGVTPADDSVAPRIPSESGDLRDRRTGGCLLEA
jgi:hypothetical protein